MCMVGMSAAWLAIALAMVTVLVGKVVEFVNLQACFAGMHYWIQ